VCTTTAVPEQSACGWALASDGRPWVAHHMRPIPTLAHHLLEAADLAGMTPGAQHAAVGHREPGRVVA